VDLFLHSAVTGRQEGRNNFEWESVLFTVALGAPLTVTKLVVEPVHQAEADLLQAMDHARNAASDKAFRQDRTIERPSNLPEWN